MSDQWTDRLSAYIDEELDDGERQRLEAHLAGCDECRATVTDLREIVARAASLEAAPPTHDLWPGIRERIGGGARVLPIAGATQAERAGRRFALSLPQLAAAAAIVAFLSGGSVWLALRSAAPEPEAFAVAPLDSGTAPAATDAHFTSGYAFTIRQLERELADARAQLDPGTVAVIEHNLDVIDAAIAEARRALAEDPANPYLNRHLDNTLMKKIEVLRRVTTIGRGRT
jgi:hypothetical protein